MLGGIQGRRQEDLNGLLKELIRTMMIETMTRREPTHNSQKNNNKKTDKTRQRARRNTGFKYTG